VRSVPAGSFARLTEFPALLAAWRRCRQGKRGRATVAAFELDWDRALLRLQRDLRDGAYRPAAWRLHRIADPKPRLIAAPAVRDRVVHHALLTEIGPTYERGFIDHHYATGRGRGPHRAVLHYLASMRRFGYRLHLDIAGYFLNVEHARLREDLFRRLPDPRTRRLIEHVIASGDAVYQHPLARQVLGAKAPPPGRGLPLGSWFSQWSGACYLDPMDHFIKRVLKIPGYLRYMDDFVLFADAPGPLEEAREAITDWLDERRGLALNPKRLLVQPNRAPGVFLGYRVARAGITPSRKLRRRLEQRLRQAAAAGDEPLIRSIRSYRGLLCFPDV
jgi:RNA-directed DNA polymerase